MIANAGEPAISDNSHPRIQILEADDGFRLQAFRSFLYFEFHSLSLIEGFVTLRLDRAVVYEDVLTALTLNEPITLAGVKPLDGSLFSSQLLTPYWEELFALVVASRGLVALSNFARLGGPKKKPQRVSPWQPLAKSRKSSHKSHKRKHIIT
jgi:hypothetical protein